jgi:hypothetical protein
LSLRKLQKPTNTHEHTAKLPGVTEFWLGLGRT